MSLRAAAGAVGAILIAVFLAGLAPAWVLLPCCSRRRAERWGWSLFLGTGLLGLETAFALATGVAPGWISFLVFAAAAALICLAWRPRTIEVSAPWGEGDGISRGWRWLLKALVAAGIVLYALRALTEPMWSNDFLAIWGLKGKLLFLSRVFPSRQPPGSLYGFSHPEYPLGLPLLYAGLASLLGHWDDHAMALLFPALQTATLAVLFGWLVRRGASWPLAMTAAGLLAWFEPLYSGFLTGMAEVPLAGAFLLFGTAYADGLDQSSTGDPRVGGRLVTAALLAGFLKNEGVFLASVAGAGAIAARRFRIAAAALIPAAAAASVSRLGSGGASLRDFDFAFLGPRLGELPARLGQTLRAAVAEVGPWGWAVLGCLTLLIVAGRPAPFADRLLLLAAASFGAYLLLPSLAVRGPVWLVQTTLARTLSALAPLVAAGIAGRFTPRSSEAVTSDEKGRGV